MSDPGLRSVEALRTALDTLVEAFAARAPHSPSLMLRVEAAQLDLEYEKVVGTQYLGGPPVPARCAYACASEGKAFVAAACMRLVERNDLALDEPLSKYLPIEMLDRLFRHRSQRHGAEVTVRQALNHTAGPRDIYDPPNRYARRLLEPHARSHRFSLADQVEAMLDVPLVAPPGEVWTYSDLNYTLLGQILEEVAGQPLHAVIRREVLEPLGLTETWSRGFEPPRLPVVASYWELDGTPGQPPRVVDTGSELNGTWELAGGGIDLTLRDSTRFISGLLRGELVGKDALIEMCRPDDLSLSLAPRVTKGTTGYGLGLYLYELQGHRFWGHDGVHGQRLLGNASLGVTVSCSFNAWNSGTADRDEDLRTDLVERVASLVVPRLGP